MYMYVYYFVLYIIFYLYHLVLQQSYSPNTLVEKCFKIVSGIIQMLISRMYPDYSYHFT